MVSVVIVVATDVEVKLVRRFGEHNPNLLEDELIENITCINIICILLSINARIIDRELKLFHRLPPVSEILANYEKNKGLEEVYTQRL